MAKKIVTYKVDSPSTDSTKKNAELSQKLASNDRDIRSITWVEETKQWVIVHVAEA